jgi:5-hmdU DNA kinase-like protein
MSTDDTKYLFDVPNSQRPDMGTSELLSPPEANPTERLKELESVIDNRSRSAGEALKDGAGMSVPQVTRVFDTYWKFVAERYRIYEKRLRGEPPPWANDRILHEHKFTNVHRDCCKLLDHKSSSWTKLRRSSTTGISNSMTGVRRWRRHDS